ncbi:MAG: antitoxin [Candidatus Omnitrophota bacterium]
MQQIVKIFKDCHGQTVRLPKGFRFKSDAVLIRKNGDDIILSPANPSWDTFFKSTPLPSVDFMEVKKP